METSVARWGRAGALYDLVASIAFVTPWTAGLVLGLFAAVHQALGLPGTPPARPDTMTLLFATLFGTVVVMWSIARWRRPEPLLITIDTAGRALFSLWFAWALWNGQTPVLAVFLVLELFWGVVQLRALLRR
ncbi:hypothetical protein SK803_38150 [Lentzea sp. BCCO 10_0856]|uniref:Uncharacterized protein n=1 Tax=Lentzea miocenica TaxID=3095431 RepID=A0ABU4TCZ0_9PSEU|nr:hypothetical protein [Lentzea sp. BCCO 10_0856]MDX8036052.1 hypothetical protein [Lentzea sp. BCCO 10_0856]